MESITQHFYRTGHSYNVCDSKFAIIERAQRKTGDIYIPSQWAELIANSKTTLPKFIVNEMKANHFVSCDKLIAKFCTNRKKSVNNEIINWFKFRKITLKKGQPLQLFCESYDDVKSKYDESLEFPPDVTKTVSVAKKTFCHNDFITMEVPLLYPQGRPITTAKKKDLMDLLEFIPQQFHKFYATLDHTEIDPDDFVVVSDEESNNQ